VQPHRQPAPAFHRGHRCLRCWVCYCWSSQSDSFWLFGRRFGVTLPSATPDYLATGGSSFHWQALLVPTNTPAHEPHYRQLHLSPTSTSGPTSTASQTATATSPPPTSTERPDRIDSPSQSRLRAGGSFLR
jgi:hypothetical protein